MIERLLILFALLCACGDDARASDASVDAGTEDVARIDVEQSDSGTDIAFDRGGIFDPCPEKPMVDVVCGVDRNSRTGPGSADTDYAATLSGCEEFVGNVDFRAGPDTNLEVMSSLRAVGQLYVTGQSEVTSLAGAESLEWASIEIRERPITDLSPLSNLRNAESLLLEDLPLTSLDGLGRLECIGGLFLTNVPLDLDALTNLRVVGGVIQIETEEEIDEEALRAFIRRVRTSSLPVLVNGESWAF